MNPWVSIVWLVVIFMLMLGLRRWIEAHIQGLAYLITGDTTVALWVFFLIFLPGTLVHELSHWLVARLLGVRTGRIVIWPQSKRDGTVWLGAIQIARADPVRSSLIGLAPLISGSLLVALIGANLQLGTIGSALTTGRWELVWQALAHSISLPDFWLWLYLLFAIANRMLPSPADREPWKPVIIFLTLLSIFVISAGWTPRISAEAGNTILNVASFLLYAFTLTVAIDVIVALLIAFMESIAVTIRQERVPY
ncbi:MAG: hypothetical protein Kow0063_14880 [Anaerolineae bacterium]